VDGEGHPEGEENIGDVEAGVEVWANAGGHRERSVEASAVGACGGRDCCEEADAKGINGQEEGQDGDCEGKARGPVADAEEMHGASGHPVQEGRLVEESDAVNVGGDVVVTAEHLAGDLDVDGVDVVEQARGEEAADLKGEPGKDEDDYGPWSPAAGDGLAISFQLSSSQSSFVGCEGNLSIFAGGGRYRELYRSFL